MEGKFKKKIATIEILIAGTGWGCIGLFVRKFQVLGLSSFEICAIRAILTICLLAIIIIPINRAYFKVKKEDILLLAANGIISLTLFNVCYFTTINLTSLSVAATLLYSSPALVMVLSFIVFGEKVTKKRVAAIALTVVGCILVSGLICDTGSLTPKGFIVGLCAGFCYALNSILSRVALTKGYNSLTISFYTFLFGFLGLVPMIRIPTINLIFSDSSNAAMAILFAVFCTLMPYFLYTKGLSEIDSSAAAITAAIEPVVATLLSIIIFNESLTIFEGFGVLMVIIAICLA